MLVVRKSVVAPAVALTHTTTEYVHTQFEDASHAEEYVSLTEGLQSLVPSLSASLALKSYVVRKMNFLANKTSTPFTNPQNKDHIWFYERGPNLKRSFIVFTPPIHGRAESPGLFSPRDSIDPLVF